MTEPVPLVIVVRGSGDVGSAVAHRLFRAGHAVVIHEVLQPAAPRRGMAFTDAVFDGSALLEGVVACRLDDLDDLKDTLASRTVIPIVTCDFADALEQVHPDVIVDARMRKRAQPEAQQGLAPLTIGLGPISWPVRRRTSSSRRAGATTSAR